MDFSSWVTAVATLILAIITGIYVVYTKKLLDAQTDPYVIVLTSHDHNRPSIIQIVIRNIGLGLARDVSFSFSRSLPTRAWGVTVEDAKDAEIMNSGPLIDGIPGLAPGEERLIDWGQYGGLIKAIGEEPIFITAAFKKSRKTMTVTSTIDIKSYSNTSASMGVEARIAGDINKIAKNLEHLTTGFNKLHIVVSENKNNGNNITATDD